MVGNFCRGKLDHLCYSEFKISDFGRSVTRVSFGHMSRSCVYSLAAILGPSLPIYLGDLRLVHGVDSFRPVKDHPP